MTGLNKQYTWSLIESLQSMQEEKRNRFIHPAFILVHFCVVLYIGVEHAWNE